ncbi:MAG TPA: hypothetical protein VKA70_18110 [Blastocatellia bacterium]|nr:hypothetical protein [Blastocatellia bacterium]
MENRNKTPELNKTTGSSPSSSNKTTTGTTPSTSQSNVAHNTPTSNTGTSSTAFPNTSTTGQTTPTAASAQRARDESSNLGNRSSEVYDQTKQAMTQAYDKTTETLSQTYNQAMDYGRENPGKLTLIAFGAGIGIGLLLAGGFSGGRSRTSRIAEPAIDALSRIALEFFR